MRVYLAPMCENCGSPKLRTYGGRAIGTTSRVRYHRCKACGKRFAALYTTLPLNLFNNVDTSPGEYGLDDGTVSG